MIYGLKSKFDIEEHKKTFTNYLEVCIDEEGEIHYAVPSHQEFLIKLCRKKLGITRDELWGIIPVHCNVLVWMMNLSGAICLWTNRVLGNPNEVQKKVIEKLKEEGLLYDYNDSQTLWNTL